MTPLSAIDTSVFVEYIDESGDFHLQAKSIVESITSGKLSGLVSHPVFAELYYVSCRLYQKLGNDNVDSSENGESPESKSEKLIHWLYKSPNISVPENTLELAIEAGKIKKEFALALVDSYVLATAKMHDCDAIFKSREEELTKGDKLRRLKKERMKLLFLEDYA